MTKTLLVMGLLWLFLAQAIVAAGNLPDLLTPAERPWLDAHPRIRLGVGDE
ncbi:MULTISPECIES: hypothetical protein [unclassified Thiocapsa]|uniref:hypothetical protein n=1 Tax=unclassified Thiocapsa TaxID=2641286 RepID=UPI0035B3A502